MRRRHTPRYAITGHQHPQRALLQENRLRPSGHLSVADANDLHPSCLTCPSPPTLLNNGRLPLTRSPLWSAALESNLSKVRGKIGAEMIGKQDYSALRGGFHEFE